MCELEPRGHMKSLQLVLYNRFSICQKVNSEEYCEKALKLSEEERSRDRTIADCTNNSYQKYG
jgi:hypothetical protein